MGRLMKYRITRLLLYLLFSSYLIVMVLSNSDRIILFLNPFERFGWERVEEISRGVYYGTYPNEDLLERYRIRILVSTLSPSLPVSRELYRAQKNLSRRLGIEFVSLPLEWNPTPESPGVQNLLRFLKSSPKRGVYISSFLFDQRIFEILQSAQIMQNQTIEGGSRNR